MRCTQLFHICYTFLQLAMSMNRPQKLHFRPQSRKAASSHKEVNLQKWSIIDMWNALVFYFAVRALGYTGCKYAYKSVADAYHVPRETFHRRLSGPLLGYFGHVAGGQTNHPQLQVEPQLRLLRKGMVSKYFTFCFISLDHM